MRSVRVLGVLVWAIWVLRPDGALADEDPRGPFSIHGGELVGNGQDAVSAGLGWPGILVQYDHGLSSSLDVGGRGELLWASPTSEPGSLLETHVPGLQASVPIRLRLSESRSVGIALGLRPGVYFGPFGGARGNRFGDDDMNLGIGLEAGVQITIATSSSMNVVAGVSIPAFALLLLDAGEQEFFFPLLPSGGFELGLADDLNLFVLGKFGPAIHVHEDTALEAMLQLQGGISYLL